jgi:hypothetical protein
MLMMKIVERGQCRHDSTKSRIHGDVLHALAIDIYGACVAQALYIFVAGAYTHTLFGGGPLLRHRRHLLNHLLSSPSVARLTYYYLPIPRKASAILASSGAKSSLSIPEYLFSRILAMYSGGLSQ